MKNDLSAWEIHQAILALVTELWKIEHEKGLHGLDCDAINRFMTVAQQAHKSGMLYQFAKAFGRMSVEQKLDSLMVDEPDVWPAFHVGDEYADFDLDTSNEPPSYPEASVHECAYTVCCLLVSKIAEAAERKQHLSIRLGSISLGRVRAKLIQEYSYVEIEPPIDSIEVGEKWVTMRKFELRKLTGLTPDGMTKQFQDPSRHDELGYRNVTRMTVDVRQDVYAALKAKHAEEDKKRKP